MLAIDTVEVEPTHTKPCDVLARPVLRWTNASPITDAVNESEHPSAGFFPATRVSQPSTWLLVENSTSIDRPIDLTPMYWELDKALVHAKDEVFEDGISSELVHGLAALAAKFGYSAISAVVQKVETFTVDVEIATECIGWLGRLNHPSSLALRRGLFERLLFSQSARRRDAAGLAIASAGFSESLSVLRIAIEREPNPIVRQGLILSAAELQKPT